MTNSCSNIEEKKVDWDFWLNMNSIRMVELAYLLANQEPPADDVRLREHRHEVGRDCSQSVQKYFELLSRAESEFSLTRDDLNDQKIEMPSLIEWLIKRDYKFSLPQEIWERITRNSSPQ